MKKWLILLLMVVTLCSVASVQGALNTSNMIVYLPFDNMTGNEFLDYSNESIMFNFTGTASMGEGFIGNASASFNRASSEYLAVSGTLDLVARIGDDKPWGVSTWVYADDVASDSAVWGAFKPDLFSTRYDDNGSFLWGYGSTTGGHYKYWGRWNTGNWELITDTYNGTHVNNYVNTTLVSSQVYAGDGDLNGKFGIGTRCSSESWSACAGTIFFDGRIDEFRLFNRSLTQTDVNAIYDLASPGAADITPPTFTDIPANLSIFNTTTINADFNSTDETGFDRHFINDTTNFNITFDGVLTNKTILAIGNYSINVTINDTSNNQASVLFTVEIKQYTPPDTITPTWITIPSNHSGTNTTLILKQFIATDDVAIDTYFINDTTNFAINTTGHLTNNTILPLNTFYINVSVNDTSNNINSTIYKVTITKVLYGAATLVLRDRGTEWISVSILSGGVEQMEYSLNNVSDWNNVTQTTSTYGYQAGLEPNTDYYFRGKNTTSNYGYAMFTTRQEDNDNMNTVLGLFAMFFIATGIYVIYKGRERKDGQVDD